MPATGHAVSLDEQIEEWRSFLRRRHAIHAVDVAELEDHLREQVATLVDAGLATDEAFLVAVKRMGSLDALASEFAREHADRLWKRLVVVPSETGESRPWARTDAIVAFCLAVAAAALIKLPTLFGKQLDEDAGFYARNAPLFVLPLLTGYFVWKRRLEAGTFRWLVAAFVAAGLVANAYPFASGGSTERLVALHLPIALWLVVGIAYAGGRWNQVEGRMDFIRFSGELFIYFVLIALGGGVLTAFMAMIFQAIGIDIEPFFESWLLPCGAVGAVVIASWLVEAKQSVIENMAPVLTRPLHTPVRRRAGHVPRNHAVDRTRQSTSSGTCSSPSTCCWWWSSACCSIPFRPATRGRLQMRSTCVQIVLVVSALLADAVALWAIAARISEFGFTPNRVAALGENVILLVNLAWSAVLYVRFLRGRGPFTALERWQTDYIPVYAVWAAIVVIVFPPVFNFI